MHESAAATQDVPREGTDRVVTAAQRGTASRNRIDRATGLEAPWPLVMECHVGDDNCPQCDGSHEHEWVEWKQAPKVAGTRQTVVIDKMSGPGVPVRCRVCGGRKCDLPACLLRRHHGGSHEWF